jgi:outer membrane protein TolC
LLLCVFIFTFAHAGAKTWEEAYRLDASYREAERAVQTATDELTKAKADPEAAPLTTTRAQEKLVEAQANVRGAKLQTTLKVLTAVGDLLTARRRAAAADARAELARLSYTATKIRHEAGMASAQELARAQEDAATAKTTLDAAQRELKGATDRVRIYVDTPPDTLPPLKVLEIAGMALGEHPTLVAAQFRVAEAKRALALAQGPDTAALVKSAAERGLKSAEDTLDDTLRVLKDGVEAAKRRYLSAVENEATTEKALTLAQADVKTAQKRFDAGAISRLALQQAVAAQRDAEAAREAAAAERWLSHVSLLQATGGAI